MLLTSQLNGQESGDMVGDAIVAQVDEGAVPRVSAESSVCLPVTLQALLPSSPVEELKAAMPCFKRFKELSKGEG